MKIAALIDFTPTTDVVVDFAYNLAKTHHAEIALVSIVDKGNNTEILRANEAMLPICERFGYEGIKCSVEIHEGNFMSTIATVVDKLHCTMSIIGTHGKRGLKQNLFGSNILKLVKLLRMPSLVVQDNTEYPEGGFKEIFFPIASHSRFEMKIHQTRALMTKGGKFNLYAIYKTDNLDDELKKNLLKCAQIFEEENIMYEQIEEEVNMFSVGYSRQSLEYVSTHKTDLISIMAQVSKSNASFGNADKENIILNPLGIPVLCCNDEEEHF